MPTLSREMIEARERLLDHGLYVCHDPECAHRGEPQPIINFGRDVNAATGIRWRCKDCDARRRRDPAAAEAKRKHRASAGPSAKDAERARRARRRAIEGGRAGARWTIRNDIRLGKLARASAYQCSRCGVARAEHWHHHLGYDREHWRDVVPVCRPCHVAIEPGPVTLRRESRIERKRVAWRPATHCKRGHELTPENAWTDRRGHRTCKVCRRERLDAARATRSNRAA